MPSFRIFFCNVKDCADVLPSCFLRFIPWKQERAKISWEYYSSFLAARRSQAFPLFEIAKRENNVIYTQETGSTTIEFCSAKKNRVDQYTLL